ncbi:hypothetical protein Acr_15g0008820 [Actinidia rufa]|uniref:Cyclin-dependent protein kinase inhibitor SMR4 n=1 Tax=Actinidia rufa TaxID=165716 RepID=A0A7J0FUM1_9ERIC|nr:hypothetical protein Acr_15g0008820 [Actinidia rufa]
MEVMMEEEYCTTPKHCKIPAVSECPPAPRKKKSDQRIKMDPPKSGYFCPPDLDTLFAVDHRAGARV